MNEDFAVLLLFFGISVTINVALAISALLSARRARRLERVLSSQPVDDTRIERLEQLTEALDVRLDQLARGQEFLSKLVSERRHALSAREREVTPH